MHCWWEYKMVQLLWKSLVVPQKLNTELPHDPEISPLNGTEKELKAGAKHTCIPCACKHYSR